MATVLTSGFALTFILSLLLKGVMSQLWNIFNTLQIILALPLMDVVMPVNLLLCKDVVDQIVNFQPVDPKVI